MDYSAHVAATRTEVAAIVEALGSGPFDVRVPTCPDWTLADLVTHIGQFSGWWADVLCEGLGRPKTPLPDPPEGERLTGWFAEAAGRLVRLLGEAPPDTSVWTWMPDQQSAAFVARRSAHELSVHRFDVEMSRGTPRPIPPELAADGIEEILMMVGHRGGSGSGETLHLHGTDRHDEWMLTLAPERVKVERTHGKGDLALRGAVSDLELTLYHRPAVGEVEQFGDAAVLDAWYRIFTFG